MMKYRNSEYNQKRNEVLRTAGLAALGLGAAVAGHILVKTDSGIVAAVCIIGVLAALGISGLRNIKTDIIVDN